MPLVLSELLDKLKYLDEITLMERLNITSEDILDRFSDIVEEKFDMFKDEFEEDEDVLSLE